MRISKLNFRSGASPGAPPLEINPANVTVLVGPNDSGKSQTLRDIESWTGNQAYSSLKVLSNVVIELPTKVSEVDELIQFLGAQREQDGKTMRVFRPDLYNTTNTRNFAFTQDDIRSVLLSGSMEAVRQRGLLPLLYVMLDARRRLELVNDRERGDLGNPTTYLGKLYRSDADREKLQNIIRDEFGLYLYLDPTGPNMRIRMSKSGIANEKSMDNNTISLLQSLPVITQYGDGIQAFVGLLIGIMTMPNKIMLVDEPESFLHPPAARTLGKYLSRIAKEQTASLIVATHSSDFLMGCLETTSEITIIRLTYDRERGTARQLAPTDVASFMKDALLRSTDTMAALFHRAAIVCEADADRVFYAEINYRLRDASRGIRDVIFLNSQGKHTVHRIASPLRQIGMPAACIYDLDIFNEKEEGDKGLFLKVMGHLGIPSNEHTWFEQERKKLESSIDSVKAPGDVNPWKRGGIVSLDKASRDDALVLIQKLRDYGIFVVPVGQLENWLATFGLAQSDKRKWLVDMLDKLTKDDVKASSGDIWEFLDGIDKWVANPKRLGIDST